ncbi:MAG: hypothetical protein H6739_01035 [Alphaproteobacteria bacterium]|nr:hypothetical protein [Alphaproteobacteria bacterium]
MKTPSMSARLSLSTSTVRVAAGQAATPAGGIRLAWGEKSWIVYLDCPAGGANHLRVLDRVRAKAAPALGGYQAPAGCNVRTVRKDQTANNQLLLNYAQWKVDDRNQAVHDVFGL